MDLEKQDTGTAVSRHQENFEGAQIASPEVLLALLDEIQQLGVRVWVHGGWAIDAVTGTSRPHKDIDLFANESDRATLRAHFQHSLIDETSHKIEFAYGSTPVEVTFFKQYGRREYATVTPRIIVRFSPGAFSDSTASLAERKIPIVSLQVLYMEVTNTVAKKRDMLEKNARDRERLAPFLTDEIRQAGKRHFVMPNTWWSRMRLFLGLL